MGARMRSIDWSKSALGPVSRWPQSLKTCVRIILTSRQPMFVWWGERLINLYNDAYRSILCGKHPVALGAPAAQVWREIWDQVGPRAERCMRANEGTYDEALLLIMERNGYPEETYYTFSYSPVPDSQGGTGGLICANTEETQRIVGERQLALLRDLATATAEVHRVEEACAKGSESLARNPHDLPFALLYLFDASRETLRLYGSAGMQRHALHARERLALRNSPWPFEALLRTGTPQVVDLDPEIHGVFPGGAWQEPPKQAALVPLLASGQGHAAGVLIVGLNRYRLYDRAYRGFLELVAGQLAASVARAQAYEDEKQRAEALAELDRAKTEFFSNVSHEFRTPLTLMLGPIENALNSAERHLSGEELDTLHRNTLRLLKLVNTLLDFSRNEAGREQIAFAPTDLAALTRDLASHFRAAVEAAGLRFEVDCPSLGEDYYIDHEVWEKIVFNLLSNAFKHTFEGEISVRLRESERGAELRIEDSGAGIPESELPHIFERFRRVQGSPSRTHEGSGIGLALVHEGVKLHGGQIEVESRLLVGSAFCITIPKGRAHLPQERVVLQARDHSHHDSARARAYVEEAFSWLPAEEAPSSRALERSSSVPRARILIADDNADMRAYIARLLRPHWEVAEACDGLEALAAIRATPPDLVLSDIMMPRMDGFALLSALRSEPRLASLPLIMLSARAGEESRVEGLKAGADDYLVKPFAARELLARVATHLELSELRRDAEIEREKLHFFFEQAPVSIAIYEGPEHRIVLFNAACRSLLGVHAQKVELGARLIDVVGELEDQPALALLDHVYASGETFNATNQRIDLRSDDDAMRERYFNVFLQPIRDAEGKVRGVMTVAYEVTDVVAGGRERERLLRERQLMAALVDASSDFIGIADPEGKPIHINPAGKRLIGMPEDAAVAEMRLYDLFPAELHPFVKEVILQSVDTQGRWEGETEFEHLRQGTRIPIWATHFQVRDPVSQQVIGIGAVTRDMTEKRRTDAEKERLLASEQEARRESERANRAKDEFLAMLGHELRNPLAPILTALRLMRLRDPRGLVRERTIIERQVDHLIRLIDDLLDVSRITGGKIELKKEIVEAAEVVSNAIEMASPLIEEREHELVVEVPESGLSIYGDPARLAQIVANLLTNAAKYTEPGGRIHIAAEACKAAVILRVRDTGIGIAPEVLPTIFEMFIQEHQALDRSRGGLGLGLNIVRSLVSMHGGSVSVYSAGKDRGSEFVVRLPASAETDPEPEGESSAGAVQSLAPTSTSQRVLVVDDNEDAADLLAEFLEVLGHQVHVVHDGPAALRAARDFDFEFALLDIGLPVMDGYELAQRLREVPGRAASRLVAITGYGQEGDRQRTRAAGFDAHLVKPIDLDVLQRLLQGAERVSTA